MMTITIQEHEGDVTATLSCDVPHLTVKPSKHDSVIDALEAMKWVCQEIEKLNREE